MERSVQDTWKLIDEMSWGVYSQDFNPFHDPTDGRFTTGHKIISRVDRLTGEVKDSYYAKAAKQLGVSEERARLLVDAVNYYTRHSKEFRAFTRDPEGFERENGPVAAQNERTRLGYIEEYIDKAPKWGGGRLYRGLDVEEDVYDNLMSQIRAGRSVDLGGPSSWSSDKDTAKLFSGVVKFADINGPKKSIVFVNAKWSTEYGTPIAHISGAPIKESEVLVSGKAKFTPNGRIEKIGPAVYVYGDIEKKLSAQDAWGLTERMMAGDFNPYHDATNGQFTFAEGANAMAPLHGKTENGERLLQGYKEKHSEKKAEPKEPSLEEVDAQLEKLDIDIALAEFTEDFTLMRKLKRQREELRGKRADIEAKDEYKKLNHSDALDLAKQMGQDPNQIDAADYRTMTNAFGYFGTSNSFRLNSRLRDGGLTDDDWKLIKTLDKHMEKSPINMRLTRMADSDGFFKALRIDEEDFESAVGKVLHNRGYSSTSYDLSSNVFSHRNIEMRIKAPKGTKLLISPARMAGQVDEAEVLLHRSCAMEIKSIKKQPNPRGWGDKYIVEAEVLY